MKTKIFKLKPKDKEYLLQFTKTGLRDSKEFERAYILLALDKGKRHEDIEDFYNVSRSTIWRVKKRYINHGLKEDLKDNPRSGQPLKYKDLEKGEVIALACSSAPHGRSRWTLRLLEETLQRNKSMRTISRETIRLLLKKTNVNLG